jgi:hypothetical protein
LVTCPNRRGPQAWPSPESDVPDPPPDPVPDPPVLKHALTVRPGTLSQAEPAGQVGLLVQLARHTPSTQTVGRVVTAQSELLLQLASRQIPNIPKNTFSHTRVLAHSALLTQTCADALDIDTADRTAAAKKTSATRDDQSIVNSDDQRQRP